MRGLLLSQELNRSSVSFDMNNIEQMRNLRDWLSRLIEEAIRQQASDFGQIMALHGKTSPERMEAFGPQNPDAAQFAEAFASLTDEDRRKIRNIVQRREEQA